MLELVLYIHMDSSKAFFSHSSFKASIAKTLFFRALFLASAISLLSLLRFLPTLHFLSASLAPETHLECLNQNTSSASYLFQSRVYNSFWDSFNCITHANFTTTALNHLLRNHFLNRKATSLCVGQPSPMLAVSAMRQLGFTSVTAVSLRHNTLVCQLHYQDSSFDFVFTKDVDKVSVPALLLLEVERVLKPGGIGALLVRPNHAPSSSSVSSMLRSSSVVDVTLVNGLTLVVFKKRSSSAFVFDHHLQGDCPSLNSTKPLIELMEPLADEETSQEHEKRISYLPKFVNMSNRKRLVYMDIGVGGVPKNVANWFFPSYPIDFRDFNVYFVHYNTSILLSHVKTPGITFVYHPGLSSSSKGEEFDFHAWFKETVQDADFVVLKMNAGNVEMKLLRDMFESGAICFVNELFLSCSENKEEKGCMDIYKGLRDSGVYVHQWWEADELHQGSNKVVDVR